MTAGSPARDASGREPAETELPSTVTMYAAVCLVAVDETYRCVFVNPAFEKLTGWSAGELHGRSFHDVTHRVRKDGSLYPDDECMLVCKDGRHLPAGLLTTQRPGGHVLVVRDLTDAKRAEEELRN